MYCIYKITVEVSVIINSFTSLITFIKSRLLCNAVQPAAVFIVRLGLAWLVLGFLYF